MIIFSFLALFTISTQSISHEAAKIAVVDLERVVAFSPQGKALQEKLQNFQEKAKNEIDQMTAKAKDIQKRMQEGGASLSQEKLAELQRKLEDETINIRRFSDEKQREGQKLQQSGLKDIEAQLQPVMTRIQNQYGFDLILNNTPGIVVMASEKVDITQLVIDELR